MILWSFHQGFDVSVENLERLCLGSHGFLLSVEKYTCLGVMYASYTVCNQSLNITHCHSTLAWEIIKSDNSLVLLPLWNNTHGTRKKSLTWERMAGSWEIVWCIHLHMYTLLMRCTLFKPHNRRGWFHEELLSFHPVALTGSSVAPFSKQDILNSCLDCNLMDPITLHSGVRRIDLLWSLLIIKPCTNQTVSNFPVEVTQLSRTVWMKLGLASEIPGLFSFEDEHFDIKIKRSNKSNAKLLILTATAIL